MAVNNRRKTAAFDASPLLPASKLESMAEIIFLRRHVRIGGAKFFKCRGGAKERNIVKVILVGKTIEKSRKE